MDRDRKLHAPLPDGDADPPVAAVWRALAGVMDPELGLDVVTLGLVYDVVITDRVARITHTVTSPRCPMAPVIEAGIREAAIRVDGVAAVETHLVWEPAWHPGMIAPGALAR